MLEKDDCDAARVSLEVDGEDEAFAVVVDAVDPRTRAFSSRRVSDVLAGREWMAFRARSRLASLSMDWFILFLYFGCNGKLWSCLVAG